MARISSALWVRLRQRTVLVQRDSQRKHFPSARKRGGFDPLCETDEVHRAEFVVGTPATPVADAIDDGFDLRFSHATFAAATAGAIQLGQLHAPSRCGCRSP